MLQDQRYRYRYSAADGDGVLKRTVCWPRDHKLNLPFVLGNVFSTFDELETKVKAYERAHFVQFLETRCTNYIEAAKSALISS